MVTARFTARVTPLQDSRARRISAQFRRRAGGRPSLRSFRRKNVPCLVFGLAPIFLAARVQVVSIAGRLNLPALYPWRDFVDAGGLMSFGPNLPDMYRHLARLVVRVLKDESPAACRSNRRNASS
jgi:hypothetical protein